VTYRFRVVGSKAASRARQLTSQEIKGLLCVKSSWSRIAVSVIASVSLPTIAFADTITYQVHSGDNLWNLAIHYHTSVSAIQSTNHLHTQELKIGQSLVIPVPSSGKSNSSSASSSSSHSSSSSVQTIRVQSGDSLWSLASRLGVSVTNLEAWNHLTAQSVLHIGQTLVVHGEGQSSLSGRSGSAAPGLSTGLRGAQIAQYAERFIGAPYRWGGESPGGFDCSGLVQFSFGHFDIHLSRDSYGQYQQGSYVSRGDLIPGDLVFFNTDGAGASHVGIYIGGGRFVNSAGWAVRISSLGDSYWGTHYVGAKRVV